MKQRDLLSSSKCLTLTVEKRMLSCQPPTSLLANPGRIISAMKILQHERATRTMWHPSHSKWHEAGVVLTDERSFWCWTCSISDWATHLGSQQWSARAASSHTHSWLLSQCGNALQSHFTQFYLVFSTHRPHSSSSKAAIELYFSKNTKHLHAEMSFRVPVPNLLGPPSFDPACGGLLLTLPWSQLLIWDWPDGNQSLIVVSWG